jgi:very-short-patch-repair endonuclease
LNVLFTRARQSVHLYTSLEPGDIVVDDTTPRGTQELRNYLEYARSGKLAKIKVGNGEPQSDFEVAVAHLLESRGYGVVPQLGVAGYFVDIAVRNPDRSGEFLAAIECDGATYHSGRSVRDRDRIRQEILEQLGWRIFRIWSTDWFRNRAREAAKLLEFLDRLRKEAAATPQPEREPLEAEPQPAAIESAAPLPIHLEVQPVRAEELYVEVGDLVTYCFVDKPEERLRIRIVDGAFDAGPAEVHEYAPLGKALLDLEVGDENELVIQDKPTRKLRLLKIDRTRSAPDSGT